MNETHTHTWTNDDDTYRCAHCGVRYSPERDKEQEGE